MAAPTATRTGDARRPPPGRLLLLGGLVAAMLLMAAETVRRTMAHRYAEDDPALALAWDPHDAAARANLANRRLAAAMRGGSAAARATALGEARAAAIRALKDGPLQASALRDLGIAADLDGDRPRALAIMSRAALRGRRDVAVQGWWLQQALARGDARAAVAPLDAMLRTEPELSPRLLPVIAASLSAPAARPAWTASLAANPPWRDPVLGDLAAKDPDMAALAEVFSDLAGRRSPPSDGQFEVLLTRMIAAGRYAEARALWKTSASPRAALSSAAPLDGDFHKVRAAPPFNWRITQPAAGVVAMERRPDVGSALTASYPSSDAPAIAEQLLTLPPGPYRLSGRWRVEQGASGTAVSWTLTCAGSAKAIGEWRGAVVARSAWTPFGLAFVVPPDCPGQWLRLTGRAGDGFGDVATAFTGLTIVAASKSG